MPARRPKQPEIIPVKYLSPEEAEARGIPAPPLPVPHDPAKLSARTLWQNWDRDRGGWTKALRFHPLLPLVKFSVSAALNFEDDPQGGHYWSGDAWIVEEHPRACQFWGEDGEMGLGQGDPLLSSELDPGWMNWRTNRIALVKGREHLEEYLLCPKGRTFYTNRMCADLLGDETAVGGWDDGEALFDLWGEKIASSKIGYKGRLYEREAALAVTPYIAATLGPARVYETLSGAGFSATEAAEAMIFKGWNTDDASV